MCILDVRSVFILAVVVSTIYCQDGKKSQTDVSDNHSSGSDVVVDGITNRNPIDVTTLVDNSTPPPITTITPPPNTTPTTKPNTTSATTPTTPTTSATTSTVSPTTTPISTTPKPPAPNTTTTVTPTSSVKPVDPTTTPAPHKDRHFDGASFIGELNVITIRCNVDEERTEENLAPCRK
ncbi:hypothetical protein Trydic_g21235 [Trypoxylus dichotomus]